ncbi:MULTISPECIES: sensor domain-containing diguanylate cyclase [unclassified Rhizobium]|uniref:sensor domain-containing diguanylate cyclase n=1 Tax=unclassified Rhizobium TaxID=2613769 RepID=UPI001ADB2E94|nr:MULTISPECIES: EAL domain-containing protein [unclassified Rhizobium]MBO9099803.1 EAL domain-containing protein [Rhizobium sp. L58/93]MBO9131654.1 EAL domain-containing protein [Rhizobium sp. B209b/85]MBO9169792.1 EAL domain-containing protein [Rhizobium sp. L245/93]MBO9185750.1 EAL domain-containing protein [Rhizobium sp. E27B/91]QXZ82513.1 EAL domain-containing protein [Rhizobium sp. K1/93]
MVQRSIVEETRRIAALQDLQIIGTAPTAAFDAIVEVAATIFGCATSVISLMAEDRQWFKAKCGIDFDGTSRSIAFCDYTIKENAPLVVHDASKDLRFKDNPLVTGDNHIRFYAGVPLSLDGELCLGALCVIDKDPREPSEQQIQQLVRLGRAVEGLLLAHRHLVTSQAATAEAHRQSREASRREALLTQVERMAAIGAWRIDIATNAVIWSDQIRILHELEDGETVTLEDGLKFYPEPDRTRVRHAVEEAVKLGSAFAVEANFITARGRKRRIRCSGDVEMENGVPAHIIGIFQDITERHDAERTLWHSAHVDHLSGLANRHWFQKDLAERLTKARHESQKVGLLLIDLDSFKEVNDTLGHQAGDEVIARIAKRLQLVAGESSFVARLGGDEFALVLERPIATDDLRTLAEEVMSQVKSPIRFQSEAIHVSASIGIACFPDDANTPDQLLRCADMALYKIKRSGRGSIGFFGPEIATIFDTRRMALEKVRSAAAANRIVPYYQPKFRLDDLSVYGFEALARIENEDGTISGPSDFWPAFADPTSSKTITRHILDGIVSDILRWRAMGIDPGTISFNACEYSFQDPDFASSLIRKIDGMKIPRSSFEVEVTETVFWGDDPKLVGRLLTELREAGVHVSLDDFGTGYASLTHLRDFPIDTLKIDQSFVAGLGKKLQNTAIVNAIVELGHTLGMKVVAEGIETEDQLEFLRSIQCDSGQGFFVSGALAADRITDMLQPDADRKLKPANETKITLAP